MSADIWLLDAEGERITVSHDPDDAMKNLVPMRVAGEATSDGFNLTYNLTPMLHAAGMPSWSDFIGRKAADAAPLWRRTHTWLVEHPDEARAHNPGNGWGTYEQAVEVIGALAQACERHPDATVGGWL